MRAPKNSRFPVSVCAASVAMVVTALAQAQQEQSASTADARSPAADTTIEEVVVVGRLRSATTNVTAERMQQAVVTDLLSIEDITRVGDSTVAEALRRVPGLTLVDNQFVYVRGLGERYSSTRLNGSDVPSPDFMRNVIPLDIFPTSILDSLSVQKGYSADMPAAFGGGSIDIRTRKIPDGPVLDIEVGGGWNFESDGSTYRSQRGGDDWLGDDDGTRALPAQLSEAISRFRGNIGPNAIQRTLQFDEPASLADAEQINRGLASALNTQSGVRRGDVDPDLNLDIAAGNRYYLGDSEAWEVGGLIVGSYNRNTRNRERINRELVDPDERFFRTSRTVNQVAVTGAVKGGVVWNGEHEIGASYLFLRNTENDINYSSGFNSNFLQRDGQQLGFYGTRYEQRELEVMQFEGRHELGKATLGLLPINLSWLEGLTFAWRFSDSTATTEVPNETRYGFQNQVDASTGEVLNSRLRNTNSAGIFRFTDLEDQVESAGWDISMPFRRNGWDVELAGGYEYSRKGRSFNMLQFFLDATRVPLDDLFFNPGGNADSLLTPSILGSAADDYRVSVNTGLDEPYLAAQAVDAAYGKFDVTWNDTWRLTAGVRWEQFNQAAVPFSPLQFSTQAGQASSDPDVLQRSVIQTDELYPSLALTWMATDFMGAEDFQFRLGYSQTVARPDLREISPAVYIDPLTESRIFGNAELRPSELTNWDARAEWFFRGGDTFTVSAFYKEINDPIETVQFAGSDDNNVLTFVNADEGEIYGVEFEGVKYLGFAAPWVGNWIDSFFLSANVTLSDSELGIGDNALSLTNQRRRLTQHSEWVFNMHLGYDAPGNRHSASLVYNVYGERIFSAGRNGAADAFEQPIHLVDFMYNFYPTERLKLSASVQNLLNEKREIDQASVEFGPVTIFEQLIGTTASASLKWSF